MPQSNSAKILYVDNDHESCEWIKNSLLSHEKGFDIHCITGASEALEQIHLHKFDVYILEYSLLEISGAELCRKIRQVDRNTPVIIYSVLYRDIDRQTAVEAGANAFVIKSDGFSNLLATVRRLLGQHPTITRNYHSARRSASSII